MKLTFLGASQTVTGSKTLLQIEQESILVDSGLYQGSNDLTALNFTPPSIDLHHLKYIFLTHGHLDHCGYLPHFVKMGFKGQIICSKGTKKIVQIILEDSAKIQEYDYKNGKIPEILYEQDDVGETMSRIETKEIGVLYNHEGFSYKFYEAGHILGATGLLISSNDKSIFFSGDIGRANDLIHHPPQFPKELDYLVLESTYGDREHDKKSPLEDLKKNVQRIKKQKSVLLIPSFAVARTQVIIQYLYLLFQENHHLKMPIYVDSPMASKVTKVYQSNTHLLKVDRNEFDNALREVNFLDYGHDREKFKKSKKPFILISSSGMISGGKVLKYFDMYAKNEKNTIMLIGFQGEDTIGKKILNGEKIIRLFSHNIHVKAKVELLPSLSAHADRKEMKELIEYNKQKIKKIILNHGEVDALKKFKIYLEKYLSSEIIIAEKNKEYLL